MKTPILGSTYVARSVNAADSRMVNLFPEIVLDGGKEAAFLQRCPGLNFVNMIGNGPIRGMWQFGAYGYVVSGDALYQINNNFDATFLGNVSGTNGPVSMADNGTQLFIACNGPSFIYDSSTNQFAPISDENFPGAVTVAYLDGYFVFNEPNSQKLWVTTLLDGTRIDPLDFASAESNPDNIVSIASNFREIWVFGTNSVEVWYDAGASDFPLQRIQGAYNELGCVAAFSVAKMNNRIIWLGKDARGQGTVYATEGYTGRRISTHAVEWHIQQYQILSDAIAYTYQQDGHNFYVLIFPSARTTWVYDDATEVWHERAGWENGSFTRHRSNCQMFFNDKVLVGDYQNGNVYFFDHDKYDDNGKIQRWLRSWRALPTGQNDLTRSAQHSLQLDCETGMGLSGSYPGAPLEDYLATESLNILTTESGANIEVSANFVQGANPQVMLRWSDDGGHTWSNEHWKSMGPIGRFGYRTIWRRLGMTMKIRDRVYEVSMTDPVKIAIVGAELHISGTQA